MKKRKVAYMNALKSIKIQEEIVPELKEKEVLIEIKSIGICGSDIVYFTKGGSAIAKVEYPHILGHEVAGKVVKMGSKVKGLCIGDKVTIEPGVPCYKCEYCKKGSYNLCEEMSFMSTPIKKEYSEGGFVEYSVRPYEMLHKLPEEMSYDQGAMIEPLAVALNAIDQSKAKAGDKVLILGSGPIAISILLSLKALGINSIYTTDILKNRIELAKKYGAKDAFNVLEVDFVEEVEKILGKNKIDLIYDTTCNEQSINTSMKLAKKDSSITIIGVPHETYLNIDMKTVFLKQMSLYTSFRYANQYPRAIDLVSAGSIEIENIITNYFRFDSIKEAMELAVSNDGSVMKIVVNN